MYKLLIKKKKKKHDKIVLVAKYKLSSIKVLISKALIDSNISHDEFDFINNVLKEYAKMKEEAKNSNNKYIWCNKRNINIRKRVYWN